MSFLKLQAVLGLDGSGFALGLKRAGSQSKDFAKSIKSDFAKAFGTTALLAYTKHLVNLAGQYTETSDRLDISTKALQEWSYAAKQSGSSIEAVTRYLEQLAVARDKALGGDANALAAFSKLGIDRGGLDAPLENIAARIAETVRGGNIGELIGALKELGGKGAGELVPAMREFVELSQEAKIVSDEHLETLASMGDQFTAMGDTIGSTLMPLLSKLTGLINNALSATSIGLQSMWAGLKEFLSPAVNMGRGGPGKGIWKAMNEAFDKGVADWERQQSALKERAAMRAMNGTTRTGSGDVLHAVLPSAKQAVENAISGSINRPPLTAWQKAGAGIQFTAERQRSENYLRDIAKNTQETTRVLSGKKSGTGIMNLGAELQ